jgi:tRNA(Ile)-lysidine synthase
MPHALELHTRQSLVKLGVKPESRLLVAVSGGKDSMALLTALREVHPPHLITVTHFNHRLRGEDSQLDEQCIRDFCAKHSLSLIVNSTTLTSPTSGLEEFARNERYAFLERAATSSHSYFVLTAHHASDQAETVLMRLMRSAGPRGLSGIPRSRKLRSVLLIRPWLDVSRNEIDEYVEKRGVTYREDSTNTTLDFERNRVRHTLMPALREAFPNRDAEKTLGEFANRMSDLSDFLTEVVAEKYSALRREIRHPLLTLQRVGLDIPRLENSSAALKPLLIELALQGLDVTMRQEDSDHVLEFLKSDARGYQLRPDVRISRMGDILVFENLTTTPQNPTDLCIGGRVETAAGRIEAEIITELPEEITPDSAFFDLDALKQAALSVRTWQEGDEIQPFGMQGTRKVADLLREAGVVELGHRRMTPLVVLRDEPSKILWIPGIRAAEFARVTQATSRVLLLSRRRDSAPKGS